MRRLGQEDLVSWYRRAWRAVGGYDRLMTETASIANDDARGAILKWVGRTDIPGDPAERYAKLRADLEGVEKSDPPEYSWFSEELGQKRVIDLEAVNAEFNAKVAGAIEQYGTLEEIPPEARTFPLGTVLALGGIAAAGYLAPFYVR